MLSLKKKSSSHNYKEKVVLLFVTVFGKPSIWDKSGPEKANFVWSGHHSHYSTHKKCSPSKQNWTAFHTDRQLCYSQQY